MNCPNHAKRSPLRWLAAISALSLGLAAGQVLAEKPDTRSGVPAIKVSYADLNPDRPAGAEALYRRIQNAARVVCGQVDARELARAALHRQCYDETMQAALGQLNRSSLYAVHKRKVKAPAAG
ncbi:MAG: UrcA family protein [Woeseia sp.]